MLAEKIKSLRKQAKLSQEQLAEKLNVSRQAVTKWETNAGVPDIENLRALSQLFGISLDALLENDGAAKTAPDYLYESLTEYDMECEKHYDISFPHVKEVYVSSYAGEKVKVRLASNLISDLQSVFKVKIDDIKKRVDIDIKKVGALTDAAAREGLYLSIFFPQTYTRQVELTGNTQSLVLKQLSVDELEFSGKVHAITMSEAVGHMAFNTNEDVQVYCETLSGCIDLNQISAASKLVLPEGAVFTSVVRGIGNHILYEQAGALCPDFSAQGEAAKACEQMIELNGMKSELVITTHAKGAPGDTITGL